MKAKKLLLILLVTLAVLFSAATVNQRLGLVQNPVISSPVEVQLIENPRTAAEKIVNGAKMEAINGVRYDAGYVRISYPGGDVPADQGACTDVIVRALRNGLPLVIHNLGGARQEDCLTKWRITGHFRYPIDR